MIPQEAETDGGVRVAASGFTEDEEWSGCMQVQEGCTSDEAHCMNKIILADSQAIFRAGTAKVLAMDDDLRIIAQCTDLDRMHHAITTFPGSIVLFAASLRPDLLRLRALLENASSRGIVIAENTEDAGAYLHQGFRGVVFRSVTGPALVECVRRVAAGDTWLPPQLMQPDSPEEDMVGTRVRDRLTPKEMRIVALIVQGCKNREIATRLKTTEQVIKNYLRSIYDKTGVSDRLELALFTIHHRVLAQAAAEVGSKLEAEEHAVQAAMA
jgi:DNA-binding NarL/FixJ family response regulator